MRCGSALTKTPSPNTRGDRAPPRGNVNVRGEVFVNDAVIVHPRGFTSIVRTRNVAIGLPSRLARSFQLTCKTLCCGRFSHLMPLYRQGLPEPPQPESATSIATAQVARIHTAADYLDSRAAGGPLRVSGQGAFSPLRHPRV